LRGETGAGQALAGVRREAGLTQQQIADRLNVDRTTVLNMEAGPPGQARDRRRG